MPCFHPMEAFKCSCNFNYKSSIVFSFCQKCSPHSFKLPCGQCVGCRLERSRQWAIRCMHEVQTSKDSCFVTLTYNDAHLPEHGSLFLRDFQLFMKRLRRSFGNGIRFFHCGEYGEKRGRPHYHVILFGIDFSDCNFTRIKRGKVVESNDVVLIRECNDTKLFRSSMLERLWCDNDGESIGNSSVGSATFESAAYVARYILKKINGSRADLHYECGVDFETGELITKKPEYITMSRRPGIGSAWYEQFSSDVYPSDEIVIPGRGKMRPPKFYDSRYELDNPEEFASIKDSRVRNAARHSSDQTPERLAVREFVQLDKLKFLVRSLD